MKHSKHFLLITKIAAILIVAAYAVGLFSTYDIVQGSLMTIVAVLIGLDLVFTAKQVTKQ